MKKTILSLGLAALMSLSLSPAYAQNSAPTIRVDEREIFFVDQQPVILEEENRTMVPARGVFEAMGAKVEWEQETKKVTVTSYDNLTELELIIDDATMVVYTYTSLMHADKTEITLDAVPQLMNDRTMIPLRAISESLSALVNWDQETATIDITTKEYQKYLVSKIENDAMYNAKTALPNLSIALDKDTVKKGETVTLSVNLSNIASLGTDIYNVGVAATIYYDATKFEVGDYQAMYQGGVAKDSSYSGGINPSFKNDSVKFAYIFLPTLELDPVYEGTIATVEFVALEDGPATFQLSDRVTDNSYDTGYYLRPTTDPAARMVTLSEAEELYIDTTPIQVNLIQGS